MLEMSLRLQVQPGRTVQGGRDYTAAEIRDALGVAGRVEDVVVRTKKKQKGSALAVMSSVEGAQAAVGSIAGCLASPLLVVPFRAKVAASSDPASVLGPVKS